MKTDLSAKPGSTIKNKTGGWRTYVPKTDYNKCIGCGLCAKVCPEVAIAMMPEKDPAAKRKERPVTDLDYCKGCGLCAAECPVKAIRMDLDQK